MQWLKSFWGAILAATFTGLAFMAANRATKAKEKAQKAILDASEADVAGDTKAAQAHFDAASELEAEAEQIKLQARDYVDRAAEQNESGADILDRWKRSNRMRGRTK